MYKHSRKLIAPLACSVLIIAASAYLFKQMYVQHQTNEHIIEQCFERFEATGAVVLQKDKFTSSLICEK